MNLSSVRRVLFLSLLLGSSSALAAKNGVIEGKNVNLFSDPNKSSDVITAVTNGEPVIMSNYPTQGFYKVRTAAGQVGWVDANSVTVGSPSEEEVLPPPSAPSVAMPAAPVNPVPEADTSMRPPSTLGSPSSDVLHYEDVQPTTDYRVRESESSAPHVRTPFELKAFVGLQLLKLTEVNQVANGTVATSGLYFGAQFGVPIEDRMNLLFRLESITRNATANGSNASLSATPIMTGLSYSLLREKPKAVKLQASLLLGIANASFTETSGSNTTQYSSSSFTEMLKMDLNVPVSRSVEIFAEAGYRFLKSASIGPTLNGNPTTGQPIIPLDFSGIFIGAGLGFLL
jgi:hypothetical protein